MSLYKAETRRLVKRRFVRVLVIGTLVAMAAIAISIFFTNQKIGPAQLAQAQAAATADFQGATKQAEQFKADCKAGKTTSQAGSCDDIYTPTQDEFDPKRYLPSTFNFRANFPAMITTFAALFALGGFVIGASYVGAEWNSGGMMTLLLWRPQRLRVLGTKLAALLGAMTALTAVVAVAWTATFALIAQLHGTTEKMTSGAWQSTALTELRALILVLVATGLGFGLASIGRHTAVALGSAAAVVVVFQFGLATVLSLAHVKFVQAYLIPVWIIAWMGKSYKFEDDSTCNYAAGTGCHPATWTLTWPLVGTVMAAIFVLVVGASMWTLRKRDIT